MASRTLNVAITGDSRDLQRAMGQAGKSTQQFEKKASASTRAVGAGFRTLAGVAGAGALVVAFKGTVEAAERSEVSLSKMRSALEATGNSYKAHAGEIDNVIQRVSKLSALDDEDLQDSFTNIVRSTGNVSKSLQLVGLAADIARAKHIDVAKAGQLVAKVAAGNTSALGRYGIQIEKGATATEALGILQDKFKGSAEAYGKTAQGANDRFRNSIENLQEKMGEALLPTLRDVTDRVSKFVDQMTNGKGAGGRFADTMKRVFDRVSDVVGVLKDVAGWLKDHPGLLKAAGAAWVAYKTAALIQLGITKAAMFATFSGATRTRLAGEAGKTGATAGRSFAAKAGAAAAAGVAGWEIGNWLRKNVGPVRSAGDFLGKNLAQALGQGGDNKLQEFVNKWRDTIQSTFSGLSGDLTNAIGQTNSALSGITGKKPKVKTPTRHKTPKIIKTASVGNTGIAPSGGSVGVTARASGASPIANTSSSTGSYGLANLVASKFGLRISSGYRSPQHNAAIGGAPGSWHTRGTVGNPGAIDLVGSMSAMRAALAWVQANVPGLAEAMIDNYAGLGWNLHIAGPGLMNWKGGGGSSTAPITSVGGTSAPAVAPRKPSGPTPAQRRAAAVKKAKSLRALQKTNLKNEKQKERAGWTKVKQTVTTAQHAGDVNHTLENPWVTAALGHIDYLVASGQMSEADGNAAKANILFNALPGLTSEADKTSALNTIGDLGFQVGPNGLTAKPSESSGSGEDPNQPLIDAQNEAAEAARQQTAALNALKDEMKRQTDFATSVAATEAGAMARWVTSVVNRVQGGDIGARGLTPAYGVARRS